MSNSTGVGRDEYALTVGFARDWQDESSDDAILVQRSTDPHEDKRGVRGIYVEVPPQRYAMYGNIAKASLSRKSFEIEFKPLAAKLMGGNHGFVAEFALDAKRFREVRDAIRVIFKNCLCYREVP